MGLRLNFGVGPLRYSAPLTSSRKKKGATGGGVALLVLLLCCGGCGAIGALTDNDDSANEPTSVETSSPARVNLLPNPTSASPTPKPTASPTPRKTTTSPKPKPRLTTQKPEPEPTEEEEVYYANCSEVREAGAAPIRRGDPGYSRKLDRDGDGIGCEN